MSLGRSLQFFRKMKQMTQEELSEKLNVSRQTISKWELDAACPEMSKAIELCEVFNCTLDQLFRENMDEPDELYSNFRCEWVDGFLYLRHIVISSEPEEDAIAHLKRKAESLHIDHQRILGWDFPAMSQELINVYNMHGYAAALVLPDGFELSEGLDVHAQPRQKYAVITIRDPFTAPFTTIPNGYKALMNWMRINGLQHKRSRDVIECFEYEYTKDGVGMMDVFIAIE